MRPQSLVLILKLITASVWTVRRHGIRIVHAGKVLPEGLVARFVSRITGVPYLVYTHGEELALLAGNPSYGRHFARLRAVYNDADAVIANSRFTRDELVRFGVNSRRIVRINPGVDLTLFSPGPPDTNLRRRYQLEGKLVLLSVGRLQKRKGHDYVLEALPKVLAHRPDLVYVILSAGEEETTLRSLVTKLGIDASVRFVGTVPLESLPAWYRSADVFILANRRLEDGDVEGFGIVFLEAGACGKPVIAGDSGGTADAVQHRFNGLRIDASNRDEIAAAVLELAGDPSLRDRLGENGRRLAEAEYGWDTVTKKIFDLSRSLVGGDRS